MYLRDYMELKVMFEDGKLTVSDMDGKLTDMDGKLTVSEVRVALAPGGIVANWGFDGKGFDFKNQTSKALKDIGLSVIKDDSIFFDVFCGFQIEHKLDLEDDDDDNEINQTQTSSTKDVLAQDAANGKKKKQ